MWAPVLWLFPTPGTLPSPPACCLPDPSHHHHPAAPQPRPTSSPKTLPPTTTSPLFHIPRGTLVKSNPIIRHSAVQKKKENFPLVNSRLPFFFFPSLIFTPSGGKMTLWAPLASCVFFRLDLSFLPFSCSFVPYIFFLFLFFSLHGVKLRRQSLNRDTEGGQGSLRAAFRPYLKTHSFL